VLVDAAFSLVAVSYKLNCGFVTNVIFGDLLSVFTFVLLHYSAEIVDDVVVQKWKYVRYLVSHAQLRVASLACWLYSHATVTRNK